VNHFMVGILVFHHFTTVAVLVGVIIAAVGVVTVVSTNRS
jgi:cell division protein FtsL